jgi:hypothetical protein
MRAKNIYKMDLRHKTRRSFGATLARARTEFLGPSEAAIQGHQTRNLAVALDVTQEVQHCQ